MMVDIAVEQQNLGHDLAIVIINDLIDQSILDRIPKTIHVYCLGRKLGSRNPLPFFKLFEILHRGFKPDVVHAHDAAIGKLIKMLRGGPCVLTVHGPGIDVSPMAAFDKLLAISNSVKRDIENRSSLPAQLLYNGIRAGEIYRRSDYEYEKHFSIVHVKRLNHERKGQDLLIKAMQILVNKRGLTRIQLCLVGDGPSFEYLQQMVLEYGLKKNITLAGNKPREWIYKNLKNYHLFAHPSRYEGFGLSVAEAMAAGVPIIASNIEGPAEILDHERYGLLFKSDDPVDLADKIEQAVRMYKNGTVESMANLAFQRCIEKFDIKTTAANYCKHYPLNQARGRVQ
jgi:glycosyltransferase involved in cell wall biosynthesis